MYNDYSLLLLLFDTIRSFPTIVLALAAVALLGPSLELVLAIVIITTIPGYARLARTSTLALKNTEEHTVRVYTATCTFSYYHVRVYGESNLQRSEYDTRMIFRLAKHESAAFFVRSETRSTLLNSLC